MHVSTVLSSCINVKIEENHQTLLAGRKLTFYREAHLNMEYKIPTTKSHFAMINIHSVHKKNP